jgi:hypothetical protein
MNANAVVRHYDRLKPEERFRLIVAAGARGDEGERDRLVNAGQRICLSLSDHSPYAHAFHELALLTFIELLEEAARYLEAFQRADDCSLCGDDGEDAEENDEGEEGLDTPAEAKPAEDDDGKRPLWQRSLDLVLAAGFMLRTKANGWKLFCERLSIPPLAGWEGLPGFDRLQRALDLAEKAAFVPEGFLRWLNAIRPAGQPERTEVPCTAEGMAAAAEDMFRERVQWWGG